MKTNFAILLIFSVICFLTIGCKETDTPNPINPLTNYDTITVNTSDVIATGVSKKYGINLNAMHDNDANRPNVRSISEALIEMGVKHLRFPGGAKSNYYYWTADANNPDPATNHFISWYADNSTGVGETLLNFDQFMTICKQTGAIPHVNVAIPIPGINGNSGLNVALAAAWVRYANITKGYGVKYWEIGNENWNLNLSDDSLANIYINYCKAMKAVDPSIITIAGCKDASVPRIIQKCGSLLDIVDVASYPNYGWGSYDYYPAHQNIDLMGNGAINLRAQGGRKTIIYEFNAIDWADKATAWPNTNDLGHALVVFEIIGQLITNKNIIYCNFWNTHWDSIWDNYNYSVDDALDKNNQLLPVGESLAVWGKFIKDTLVNITRPSSIISYAAYDPNTGGLNLFLSNKAISPQTFSIRISSTNNYSKGKIWQLKGTGPDDTNPSWGETGSIILTGNKISKLNLPPVSITVVSLSK